MELITTMKWRSILSGSDNKHMNKGQINKKLMITMGILLLAALIYYFYNSGSSKPTTSLVVGRDVGGVGAQELQLLNQIRSLRIETDLFKDPAYTSLVDYSVAIKSENVGRPNPFAPVAGVPSPFAVEPAPTKR